MGSDSSEEADARCILCCSYFKSGESFKNVKNKNVYKSKKDGDGHENLLKALRTFYKLISDNEEDEEEEVSAFNEKLISIKMKLLLGGNFCCGECSDTLLELLRLQELIEETERQRDGVLKALKLALKGAPNLPGTKCEVADDSLSLSSTDDTGFDFDGESLGSIWSEAGQVSSNPDYSEDAEPESLETKINLSVLHHLEESLPNRNSRNALQQAQLDAVAKIKPPSKVRRIDLPKYQSIKDCSVKLIRLSTEEIQNLSRGNSQCFIDSKLPEKGYNKLAPLKTRNAPQQKKRVYYYIVNEEMLLLLCTPIKFTVTQVECLETDCSHVVTGSDFRALEEMKSHVVTNHEPFYDSKIIARNCPFCRVSFSNGLHLRLHLFSEHMDNEVQLASRLVLCESCGRSIQYGAYPQHVWHHKSTEDMELAIMNGEKIPTRVKVPASIKLLFSKLKGTKSLEVTKPVKPAKTTPIPKWENKSQKKIIQNVPAKLKSKLKQKLVNTTISKLRERTKLQKTRIYKNNPIETEKIQMQNTIELFWLLRDGLLCHDGVPIEYTSVKFICKEEDCGAQIWGTDNESFIKLRNHVKFTHRRAPDVQIPRDCPMCNDSFQDVGKLKEHVIREYDPPAICTHCWEPFQSHEDLINHSLSHKNKSETCEQLKVPKKKSPIFYIIDQDFLLLLCTPIKFQRSELQCLEGDCSHVVTGSDYFALEEMKSHVEVNHEPFYPNNEILQNCPICKLSCSTGKKIRQHILNEHGNNGVECQITSRLVLCECCGRSIQYGAYLQHVWTHKSAEDMKLDIINGETVPSRIKIPASIQRMLEYKENIKISDGNGTDGGTAEENAVTNFSQTELNFNCDAAQPISKAKRKVVKSTKLKVVATEQEQDEDIKVKSADLFLQLRDGLLCHDGIHIEYSSEKFICKEEGCGVQIWGTDNESFIKLRNHVKFTHRREPDVQIPRDCPMCNDSFQDVEKLKEHVIREHAPPAICTHCWEPFQNHEDLISHSLSHIITPEETDRLNVLKKKSPIFYIINEDLFLVLCTPIKIQKSKLQCLEGNCSFIVAGSGYYALEEMKSHVVINHEPFYKSKNIHQKCPICKLSCSTGKRFRLHILNEHGNNGVECQLASRLVLCESCEKPIQYGSYLQHVWTHKSANDIELGIITGEKVPAQVKIPASIKRLLKNVKIRDGSGEQETTSEENDLTYFSEVDLIKNYADLTSAASKSITERKKFLAISSVTKNKPKTVLNLKRTELFLLLRDGLLCHDGIPIEYSSEKFICKGGGCGAQITGLDNKSFNMLRAHVKFTHRRDQEVQIPRDCPMCGESFQEIVKLKEHIISEHAPSAICTHCWEPFPNHEDLPSHLLSHSESEKIAQPMVNKTNPKYPRRIKLNGRYSCGSCPKVFKFPAVLRAHELIHIPKELREHIKCPDCEQQFLSQVALRGHIERVHRPDLIKRKRECPICGKQFHYRQAEGFKRHMRTHSGEKPWICEICGMRFRANAPYKKHKRCVHSNERPFQCEFCEVNYKYSGNLTRHREAAHKDLIPEVNLELKMKFTLPEYRPDFIGPKIAYPCDFCEKVFQLRSRMTKHVKIHHSSV